MTARPDRELPRVSVLFQIERGRAGSASARQRQIVWQQWSPNWQFDDACFERNAVANDNPDYVDW